MFSFAVIRRQIKFFPCRTKACLSATPPPLIVWTWGNAFFSRGLIVQFKIIFASNRQKRTKRNEH